MGARPLRHRQARWRAARRARPSAERYPTRTRIEAALGPCPHTEGRRIVGVETGDQPTTHSKVPAVLFVSRLLVCVFVCVTV